MDRWQLIIINHFCQLSQLAYHSSHPVTIRHSLFYCSSQFKYRLSHSCICLLPVDIWVTIFANSFLIQSALYRIIKTNFNP